MAKEYTPFGKLLDGYMRRNGMRQKDFSERMLAGGYSGRMRQGMISQLLYRSPQVSPEFFDRAGDVLNLSEEEVTRLMMAWRDTARGR